MKNKEKRLLTPRNPLVAAARFRRAGPHVKSSKAMRAAHKKDLRKELG